MSKKILYLFIFITFCGSGSLFAQLIEQEYRYGGEQFERSRTLYDYRLIKKSEELLLRTIKSYPEMPTLDKSTLLQAYIDLMTGNFKIADNKLAEFINLRNNSPFVAQAALQRGIIAFEQKRYDWADVLFRDAKVSAEAEFAIRKQPDYAELAHIALYWQGIALSLQGKHFDAIAPLEECVTKYPEYSFADDALYTLGQISEMNRKFETAIEYFNQIGSRYQYSNTYIASRLRQANNKLILRQSAAALLLLQNAENAVNHIAEADSIGLLYEKQSYITDARESITYLRGEAYNLAGNYDQAIIMFNAFLETYSNSEFINFVRLGAGWALLNKGQNDAALKHYDDIIFNAGEDESRTKAIAQLYRVVALKRSGLTEQARRELSALSVQSSYPFLGQALLELGQIYYETTDYEQARRTLERADRESLDASVSVRINLLLGAVYMEQKLYERAVAEFKKAENIASNSSEIFMPQKNWFISEARLKQGIANVLSHRSGESIQSLREYIGDTKGSAKTGEALFWLAEAYYRSELFNNSVETYNALLSKYPQTNRREEALYGLGWSYFRQKNFKESSKIFDKMIAEFPNSKFAAEVLVRQGDGYYFIKNYSQAAESYRRAASLSSGTEEGQYASYQLCHALYRLGNFEAAVTSLLSFVRNYSKSPYSPNALYLIGWIRFQQKKYPEAIDNFKFLIQAYSQSSLAPRAHYAIGDSYYNMEQFSEAIEAYKTVIQSFPSSDLAPEAMKSIQYCLMALGRESEAVAIADTFIAANPTSPFAEEFKYKKAEMFYTGRKYKDAIDEYENFMKKYPESRLNAEAYYWTGKSYISLNEPENAEKAFTQLQKAFPQSDFAQLSMLEQGLMYKELGDAAKADSILLALQTRFPYSQSAPQAGFERAVMKFSMGDTVAAMQIFRTVADSFPRQEYSDQSRYRIAMYLRSKGFNDSARAEFAILAAREDAPALAAQAQYTIGELWMRDKNFNLAIKEFSVVKEKYTGVEDWYSLALLNMGECYENIEEPELARQLYESLAELRPEDDFGKTAKRRLQRLGKK